MTEFWFLLKVSQMSNLLKFSKVFFQSFWFFFKNCNRSSIIDHLNVLKSFQSSKSWAVFLFLEDSDLSWKKSCSCGCFVSWILRSEILLKNIFFLIFVFCIYVCEHFGSPNALISCCYCPYFIVWSSFNVQILLGHVLN